MAAVKQHNANIRKRRILDKAVLCEPVIWRVKIEEPLNYKVVVYEDVIEEFVFDDMLIFEGGIEEAIKAKAMDNELVYKEELPEEVMNAKAMDVGIVLNEEDMHAIESDKVMYPKAMFDDEIPDEMLPDMLLSDDEDVTDEEATVSVDGEECLTGEALRENLLSIHKNIYNIMNMKVDFLHTWEDRKRDILEYVVKRAEEVYELEDRLDNMLELLDEQNIKIDENDFLEFQRKYMEENPIYEPLDDIMEHQPQMSMEDDGFESNEFQSTYSEENPIFEPLNDELMELQPQTPTTDDGSEILKESLEKNLKFEPLDELMELQPQTPKRQKKLKTSIKISATSTPIKSKPIKTEIVEMFVANEDGLVVIGPHGTTIAKTALEAINWSLSGAALTRKILMEVFDRETLAFHTLTGKPSPAFIDCDKPMKNQLDPLKVADIIHLVMEHKNLTAKEVRNAITTKCADENKMYRQREKKKLNAALKLQKEKQKS